MSEGSRRTESEVRAWLDGAKSAVWDWTPTDDARTTSLFWQGYETALDHLAGFLLTEDEDRL